LSGYIFATKARIDNRKKLVKQRFGPTNLDANILKSNFYFSSGHFSGIAFHHYADRGALAKQPKAKDK